MLSLKHSGRTVSILQICSMRRFLMDSLCLMLNHWWMETADYKMHLVQIHKNGNLHFRNEGVRTVFVNCRLSYTCNVFCDWKRHSKYATLSPDKVL